MPHFSLSSQPGPKEFKISLEFYSFIQIKIQGSTYISEDMSHKLNLKYLTVHGTSTLCWSISTCVIQVHKAEETLEVQ